MWQKLIRRAWSAGSERPSDRGTVRVSSEAHAVVQQDCLAVFHAGRGAMFKANAVGAHIWEGLSQETPLKLVAEQLVQRYGIPAQQGEQDVARFVAELRNAGLVVGAGV